MLTVVLWFYIHMHLVCRSYEKKLSMDVEPEDLGQILDRLFTVKLCDVV